MATASDFDWMRYALKLASKAADIGEVPVGAVIVGNNAVIGEGWNQPITSCDPSAHAEIIALRNAASNLRNYRLPGTTLYVTIEPCTMCFGALVHARVERIVYGTVEPKAGVIESNASLHQAEYFNHQLTVEGGVMGEACSQLISDFFDARRKARKSLKNNASQSRKNDK